MAAQINVRNSLENPKNDADINILGTLNLLDSCLKYKIKKIIFSSTGGAIYGGKVKIPTSEGERENPESPYGIAKLTIEKYLEMLYIFENRCEEAVSNLYMLKSEQEKQELYQPL